MKKSKLVAVLVISAMLFSAMPGSAYAEESGAFWSRVGLVGGAVLGGAAAILTGGAAIPFIAGGALIAGTTGAVADGNANAEDALEAIADFLESLSY